MGKRVLLMLRAAWAWWPILGIVARWRRDAACLPALERVKAAARADDGEASFQAYLELRAATKDGSRHDVRG
jgi:hypothetical protein